MLQMTIARWRSPNGEWYQDRGVPPQIEVIDDPNTETDELLQTAVELLLAINDWIRLLTRPFKAGIVLLPSSTAQSLYEQFFRGSLV